VNVEDEAFKRSMDDATARLLLNDPILRVRKAEELYLDHCMPEVVRLLESDLSNEELGRHPLMHMLRSLGSRGVGGIDRVMNEEQPSCLGLVCRPFDHDWASGPFRI
jgi:hypothetical protein